MMKVLVVFAGAFLLGMPAHADPTTKALMREKLDASHELLDAMALEDYPNIQRYAELLLDVSRATTWHQQSSPEFMVHATSFRNSTEYLKQQAAAKNLEGVSMGYIRVVMDCVQCHEAVRKRAPTPK